MSQRRLSKWIRSQEVMCYQTINCAGSDNRAGTDNQAHKNEEWGSNKVVFDGEPSTNMPMDVISSWC